MTALLIALLVAALVAAGFCHWKWLKATERAQEAEKLVAVGETRLAELQASQQSGSEMVGQVYEQLEKNIKLLSSEQAREHNEQASRRLAELLKPMEKDLGRFSATVEKVMAEQSQTQTRLDEKFKHMDASVKALGDDANRLADSLLGSSKTRGDWGEVLLRQALEASGLREGEMYDFQRSFTLADSSRVVPDVVLHLPGDRDVVIDSKVAMVDYQNYLGAQDDKQRDEALRAVHRAMEQQAAEIADKYADLPGLNTTRLMIMYTPAEQVWQLAMEQFPAVFDKARERGVQILGPVNFLACLRLIEQMWLNESSTRNVREIVERAGRLLDAVVTLGERIEKVDKQAHRLCDDIGQVKTSLSGRQGVLMHIQRLQKLGAQGQKPVPRIGDADELDDEPAALVVETQGDDAGQ